MAAIPKELIESELFGYEKGALLGGYAANLGKFEEAK
jgi:transcriptional regulator with GAF, ATPase, and Fis domain